MNDITESIDRLGKSHFQSGYLAALSDVSKKMEVTERNVKMIRDLLDLI